VAVDPERRIVAAAQTAGITRILTADYTTTVVRAAPGLLPADIDGDTL